MRSDLETEVVGNWGLDGDTREDNLYVAGSNETPLKV